MGFTFLSCRKSEKERKVSEYYKKQEKLLEGFNEMETINETGFVSGAPSEVSTLILSFLFLLESLSLSIYSILFIDFNRKS